MPAVMKKRPTEEKGLVTLKLQVHRDNVDKIRAYVETVEAGENKTWTVEEVFPEYLGREGQITLRAYRHREGLTQKQLAGLTGIPQHHLSEMENGKRGIGRERARKLAEALKVSDYRLFL